jgi:large conductance mechanosensitive channel
VADDRTHDPSERWLVVRLLSDFKQFLFRGNINNLITFVSVAAAVFFLIVAPINKLMAAAWRKSRRRRTAQSARPAIPAQARRCPQCTAQLTLG